MTEMTEMTEMTVPDPIDEVVDGVRDGWTAFVEASSGLRPELFAFGLRLTGNPFDGEDLVQEALIRGFGAAAFQDGGVRSVRSYLFRTMANLWIDQQRRTREDLMATVDGLPPTAAAQEEVAALRTGVERLLAVLAPREQAALVLHEGFGFRHGEIAELLASTEGAVRSALHRARSRLAADGEVTHRHRGADPAVVDRFVEAFRAGDIDALQGLLAGGVETVVFPAGIGVGATKAAEAGWLRGSLYHHHRGLEERGEPYPNQVDVVELAGETVLAVSRHGDGGVMLEEIWRFETADGVITRVRDYGFCPDLVSWAGTVLGMPVRRLAYDFGGHQP